MATAERVDPPRQRHGDRADPLRQQRVGGRLDERRAAFAARPDSRSRRSTSPRVQYFMKFGRAAGCRLQARQVARRVARVRERDVEDEVAAGLQHARDLARRRRSTKLLPMCRKTALVIARSTESSSSGRASAETQIGYRVASGCRPKLLAVLEQLAEHGLGDVDRAVGRPGEPALACEVERDPPVARADLEHGLELRSLPGSGPRAGDLRRSASPGRRARRADGDRGANMILAASSSHAAGTSESRRRRPGGRMPSRSTSSLARRIAHCSGATLIGGRVSPPSQSTRPIQRSRFSAYQCDRLQDAFLPRDLRLPARLAVELLVADAERHHVGGSGAEARRRRHDLAVVGPVAVLAADPKDQVGPVRHRDVLPCP